MRRLALAGGALGVAGALALLLVATRPAARPTDGPAASAATQAAKVAPPADPSAADPTAASPSAAPADSTAPAGASAPPATTVTAEHASLPGPAEVAAARARVAAERVRPDFLSPDLDLDHKLKARPLRDARKAYRRGDFEAALARAQDALAVEPTSNAARVLATLAACSLDRPAVARSHAAALDDMRLERVAGRCRELGVDLDGTRDRPEEQRPTSSR